MSQNPTGTLGKYQIIREIARSNDIVYEAYDPDTNRRIAIKELASTASASQKQRDDRLQRFKREARAAGSLVHPNIVTVYEVGEDDGRHFIAMEYLDGRNLRDELDEYGALDVDRSLEIAINVLKGLKFAHERGVIHRDIKPENIQLLSDGRIKITDFGIARLTFEPNLTMDGQVFGTPSYMSPEQIGGRDIDPRSDIFSIGIVLYEMLKGAKPFTGDNVMAITYAIMNSQPEQPNAANYTIWSILQRALDKSPHLRYDSANEMIEDLEAALLELTSGTITGPQQPGYYAPNQPPYGQPAGPIPPVGGNWQGMQPPPFGGANPYQQQPPYQQPMGHGQQPYGGPAAPPVQQGSANPWQQPQGPPNPHHPSYGQPYPGAPMQPDPYGAYQHPGAYPQGNPYGQRSVIPVYLPPPRKRPVLSPATKSFLLQLLLWFLVIGSLVGGTIYFIRSITGETGAQGTNLSSDFGRPAIGEQPSGSPSTPIPSEIQRESSDVLLSQAETAVILAQDSPNSEMRDAYFEEAAVRFAELVRRDSAGGERIRRHAAALYFDAAAVLYGYGDSRGARSAIYYAKGFTTDPRDIEILDQWLEAYGA